MKKKKSTLFQTLVCKQDSNSMKQRNFVFLKRFHSHKAASEGSKFFTISPILIKGYE